MTVLVFDGPEKAGKTTLINATAAELRRRGFDVNIRRWGPVDPDDRVYAPALQKDVTEPETFHLWDRSWASEYVYATLLNRNRRLNREPWLGEWLHGRAVSATGAKFMVLGLPQELTARRDATDLPVDPGAEFRYFRSYQIRNAWYPVTNEYTDESLATNVNNVLRWSWPNHLLNVSSGGTYRPPHYAGPISSPVLIVGKARSEFESVRGAWLPFTSRLTTEFGRRIGVNALHCGWTNLADAKEEMFWGRSMIVFCGKGVDWPYEWIPSGTLRVNVDHPSFTYRFNAEQRVLVDGAETNDKLESMIDRALAGEPIVKEIA